MNYKQLGVQFHIQLLKSLQFQKEDRNQYLLYAYSVPGTINTSTDTKFQSSQFCKVHVVILFNR